MDLSTLIKLLARAADQNILISQHVQGKATVLVREMPWDKVFTGILDTNGLAYAREGDLLRIVTIKDLEREIQMMDARQVKAAKIKEYQLRMNSLKTRASMVEPLKTWVYHVRYADTQTLRDNLDKFFRSGWVGTDWTVSGKDQGKVGGKVKGAILVDPHTNSLVIQAVQSDIDRLKETVLLLDVPTKQVLIEAHIVQATDSAARKLGVKWGGAYDFNSGDVSHSLTGDLDFGLASGLTLGYLGTKIGQHTLSLELSALENEDKLNILSRPSITTLDKQNGYPRKRNGNSISDN